MSVRQFYRIAFGLGSKWAVSLSERDQRIDNDFWLCPTGFVLREERYGISRTTALFSVSRLGATHKSRKGGSTGEYISLERAGSTFARLYN